jgi:hypothetical protein
VVLFRTKAFVQSDHRFTPVHGGPSPLDPVELKKSQTQPTRDTECSLPVTMLDGPKIRAVLDRAEAKTISGPFG